jgi:putative nucleotidyltransferase with HDIG domain
VKQRRETWLQRAHIGVLVGALTAGALSSRAEDWSPTWLVLGLVAAALISDALSLQLKTLRISGSFSALVLAMSLLGPAPAMVIGLVVIGVACARDRLKRHQVTANLAAYAVFPLVGGLMTQALAPWTSEPLMHSGVVFCVFLVTIFLNFLLIYGDYAIRSGTSLLTGFRTVFLPLLPVDLATGLLTAGIVLIQEHAGPVAVGVLAVVALVFQYLLRAALDAVQRGDQLDQRNKQLATLQFGLISTTLKTLALRDNMTARHSAAVARYSREMAKALGLGEREQELIHTAGLFHDIGKFIFPDSILLSTNRLSDEDFEIVKRHPEVGAQLIGEIEGFGPVAEIVRAHHERIDGRGYPNGISGESIPLGSRIIAVADTYDVMTARDTYRNPVSISDAIAELRRVAGAQLDAHLVEVFIDLVSNHGLRFQHGGEADFEAELALERRVRDYAEPKKAA